MEDYGGFSLRLIADNGCAHQNIIGAGAMRSRSGGCAFHRKMPFIDRVVS